MKSLRTPLLALASLSLAACGDEGSGTARFTTWGEEYVENEIPADPKGEDGFVDGWTVKYDKFLVVFHELTVADGGGAVGARFVGPKLVDNVRPGRKELVVFPGLAAKRWDAVSYQIKPATAATDAALASTADKDLMVANGLSIYVAGTATKPGAAGPQRKTFRWGFKTATQYKDCQQPAEGGAPILGVVVKAGGTDTSELTTHGDHFFYDRLQSSSEAQARTSLRFDALAAADADDDGEITLEELGKAPLDPRLYDPSGFDVTTLGQFVTALARTVGHFRGEGECAVAPVR